MCDKSALQYATRCYWKQPRNAATYSNYIRRLLPKEMACAALEADKRLPGHSCEKLIFLVGHSLEPLFQSVWAYRPKSILLILSPTYQEGVDGKTWGDEVKALLSDALPVATDTAKPHVECLVVDDNSSAVFNTLKIHVRENPDDLKQKGGLPVIIDITGAKKCMVAGAFLFAAYSGVPVSYVDFDNEAYDPEAGRPFGYACRIGEVQNPYRLFALRDWEYVRTLYSRFNFRGARQVIEETIIPAMLISFSDSEIEHAVTLCEVLCCYELWNNGDYCSAYQKVQDIQITSGLKAFTPPTAVAALGRDNYWPHSHTAKALLGELERIELGYPHPACGSPSLYLQPELLLTYARDEEAKIGRLIDFNEDYRSALLRAVGLWEVIIRAMFIGLWHTDLLDISLNRDGPYVSRNSAPNDVKDWEEEIYKTLTLTDSGVKAIEGLRYTQDDKESYKGYCSRIVCKRKRKDESESQSFYVRRGNAAPRLSKNAAIGMEQQLRNKAIHTYLSVPRNIAQATYEIARRALNEYERDWVEKMQPKVILPQVDTSPMPWTEISRLCGLDFLPANLQRD